MFQRRIGLAWACGLAALMLATMAQANSTPRPTAAEALTTLYVPMQEALAGDSVAAVREQAAKVAAEAAAALQAGGDRKSLEAVAAAAKGMTAMELPGLRDQFKPLSLAIAHLVEKQAVLGLGIFYCPMVDAYWIQKTGEVRNPYYGKQMTSCGEQVTKVED